jgi:hypothetical protein
VFTRGKERKATLTARFSLAHLTVLSLAPPEVVEVAARTGYQTVGLRLFRVMETTPGYPLMDDKPMMRATKTAMAATGVGVLDIELVRITPDIEVASLEPFLAAGAELGARYVITSPYDSDLARLADRLAAISDLASRYGLRAVLEFFPWTVVPDLGSALRMVEAANGPNSGYWWTRFTSIDRPAGWSSSIRFPPHDSPSSMYPTRRCRRAIRPKNCCTAGGWSGCRPARAALISRVF